MILVDPGATEPPGRPYWTTPEMSPPLFATHVVANVFFGRSTSWIKQHIHEGHHIGPEGNVLPVKSPSGHYRWRLYDIERFGHTLAAGRYLQGRRLELAIQMVRTVANLYDLGT